MPQELDGFKKNFENAHFIAIIRNGYAVAEGIRRKGRPRHLRDGWPIDLCARQWSRSNEILAQDADHLEHILWVRYEDFTEEPMKELNRILSFLGVTDVSVMDLTQPLEIHERKQPISNLNHASVARLSRDERKIITATAGASLIRFGYELLS